MAGPLRSPRPFEGPGRLARLERSLLRIHALILTALAVVTVMPATFAAEAGLGEGFTQFLPAAAYLWVAVDLQLHGERVRHLGVLGAVPLVVLVAGSTYPLWSYGASSFCVGAFALSAARLLRTWWYILANVAVGIVWVIGRGWLGGELWAGVDETLMASTMAFAAAVFTDVIAEAARQAERADSASRAEREALIRDEAEQKAVALAERIMHDEVLHALRVVASADRYDHGAVRGACDHAVASVRQVHARRSGDSPGSDASGVGVAALRARWEGAFGLNVHVAGDGAIPPPVSPAASAALVRAVEEALRNVSRHSGTSDVKISVHDLGNEVRVDVADSGTGLRPSQVPGFGIQRSIVSPVNEAGGQVRYSTTPGGGTTVSISLPTAMSPSTGVFAKSFNEGLQATKGPLPLAYVVTPIAIPFAYMSLRYADTWPVWPGALAMGLAYLVVTAVLVRRISTGPLKAATYLGIVTTLLTLEVIALLSMPQGALLDGRSFPIGFQAVPLMALLMMLPSWLGLITLLPYPLLVSAAWLLDPGLSNGVFPLGAIQACLLLPSCTLLVGHTLRRIGREILRDEAEVFALARMRAQRRSAALITDRHLDYTRRVVAPWLAEIAQGVVDAGERDTKSQASLLAANVRDDLYAPGYLGDEHREAASRFRLSGGALRIRPGTSHSRCDAVTGRVLTRLLGELDPAHTITVTPPGPCSSTVRVAVVPPAEPRHLEAVRDIQVEQDAFSTVISINARSDQEGLT